MVRWHRLTWHTTGTHAPGRYLPVRSRCLHPGQQQGRRYRLQLLLGPVDATLTCAIMPHGRSGETVGGDDQQANGENPCR
jgi:hypothetical protein